MLLPRCESAFVCIRRCIIDGGGRNGSFAAAQRIQMTAQHLYADYGRIRRFVGRGRMKLAATTRR
jgi:hypothetical protein